MSQAMLFDIGADHSLAGRDELDRYYTPGPVADALVQYLPDVPRPVDRRAKALEGHVGDGAWVRALRKHSPWRHVAVHGSDIDPEARGLREADCSFVSDFLDVRHPYDAVLGNPPYRVAEDHVRHALSLVAPRLGVVAFLLRLAFLESVQRVPLWRDHRPARVVVLSRRPSFTGSGTDAAAYGFFIWDGRHQGPTELLWADD